MKFPSLFINSKQRYINVNSSNGGNYQCFIGKNGYIPADKGREGDKKTPLGKYHLRFGFYRPDRVPPPKSPLTFWPMRPDDGWCDEAGHPAYNRFVQLPFGGSHEKLWREDGLYDIVLVMSHNDSPPQIGEDGVGLGSAVFIHIASPEGKPTLGCVAAAPDAMSQTLPSLYTGMEVIIHDSGPED